MVISKYIEEVSSNPGVTSPEIGELNLSFRNRLPDWYLNLLETHNGIEGFIGKENYLIIYSLEDASLSTNTYSEFSPNLFFFGSNGGDAGYAVDLGQPHFPIVEVTFVDMEIATDFGSSLEGFLEQLSLPSEKMGS